MNHALDGRRDVVRQLEVYKKALVLETTQQVSETSGHQQFKAYFVERYEAVQFVDQLESLTRGRHVEGNDDPVLGLHVVSFSERILLPRLQGSHGCSA